MSIGSFKTLDECIHEDFLNARPALLAAIHGQLPCDTCIRRAVILNSFTGDERLGDIWIKDGFIVFVDYDHEREPSGTNLPTPLTEYDANNRTVIPGFVDTHMHIESTMLTPDSLGKILAPLGTTTIFADPHEIVNVGGHDALIYMLESAKYSPIRQYFLIPSSVPAVPSCENAGASLNAAAINDMFDHLGPGIVGLAEVMDYIGVIKGDKRMHDIIVAALNHNAFVQGHILNAKGRSLATYILSGVESNHENLTGDDITAALLHGLRPNIRLTSSLIYDNISNMVEDGIMNDCYISQCSLCTDDVHITDIINKGHINRSLRILIDNGVLPSDAVRMATLNAWNEYHVKRAGAIAEGYIADLQILPKRYYTSLTIGKTPDAVFVRGKLVAALGKLVGPDLSCKSDRVVDFEAKKPLNIKPIISDFAIPCDGDLGDAKANVIEFEPDSVITRLNSYALPVVNDQIDLSSCQDFCFIAVFNRYGLNNLSKGILKNYRLKGGAIASTISHDSHNLTVIYKDASLAHKAVLSLQKAGGGICFVNSAGKRYLVPLEVGGLMSAAAPAKIVRLYKALDIAFKAENGTDANPMSITVMALPVIPEARMSDLGIVDVAAQTIVPLFPD